MANAYVRYLDYKKEPIIVRTAECDWYEDPQLRDETINSLDRDELESLASNRLKYQELCGQQ